MRRKSRISAPTQSRRAFTLVEVMISAGILVTIMGMFVAALESGTDSFITGCARGVLSARAEGALDRMATDLKEAQSSAIRVATTGNGLSANLGAIVMSSSRDSSGVFHVTGAYGPDWRAVIIYCPYTTSKGVSELRRYVYFDDARAFTFPFDIDDVTADEIRLTDALSQPLVMSRPNGNTSLEAGREFEVLCPGITGLELSTDTTSRITLRAGCITRKNISLDTEVTRDVAHRN